MKLCASVHQVRLGQKEFRVLQPKPTPVRMTLRNAKDCFILRLDSETAWRLAAFLELAAKSRDLIVYFPIRHNKLASDSTSWQAPLRPLDLLLTHHSRQFRPSAWPRIRERLKAARPRTAKVPDPALVVYDCDPPDQLPFYYRENHDRFVHHVHAEALLLTGSRPAFASIVRLFTNIARHPYPHDEFRPSCFAFDIKQKRGAELEMLVGHTEDWPDTTATNVSLSQEHVVPGRDISRTEDEPERTA